MSDLNTLLLNFEKPIDPSEGTPVTETGPYTTTASVPFGRLEVNVIVCGDAATSTV